LGFLEAFPTKKGHPPKRVPSSAIEAVMRDSGSSFQELTDEAFADLLKKHKQPVGLKASLKESVTTKRKPR
jgi:hypothetical protein